MAKRYIVLDQNVMQRDELKLKELLATEPNLHFVLPDLAFLEMTKSDKWESTLSNSLSSLSGYPARIHVCYSVDEALRFELDNLRPITGHMLYPEATAFVRDILESIHKQTSGYALDRMRADLEKHREAVAKDYLDHPQNKQRLRELIESTKSGLPSELQKRMRSNKVDESERLQIIHEIAVDLFPQVLAELTGISIGRARAFMKQKPLSLRFLFVKAWYWVYWIEKGGFDCFPEEGVTREETDQQYVLSASFFHDLQSKETRVNDAYYDLKLLLKKKV